MLADGAAAVLSALGVDNVQVHTADGTLGWPTRRPTTPSSSPRPARVPAALLAQLAVASRLVMPVGGREDAQLELLRLTRVNEHDDASAETLMGGASCRSPVRRAGPVETKRAGAPGDARLAWKGRLTAYFGLADVGRQVKLLLAAELVFRPHADVAAHTVHRPIAAWSPCWLATALALPDAVAASAVGGVERRTRGNVTRRCRCRCGRQVQVQVQVPVRARVPERVQVQVRSARCRRRRRCRREAQVPEQARGGSRCGRRRRRGRRCGSAGAGARCRDAGVPARAPATVPSTCPCRRWPGR